MGDVKRIYPESKTGLINWIEQNFHDIDQYVVTFKMKDGTTVTAYDAYSYFDAVAMSSITENTIHTLSYEGQFIPKERR